MNTGNRLIVALDVDDMDSVRQLVDKLSPRVKIFKVGSELFTACGHKVVDMLHDKGCEVFLDLKFHDIPHTVARVTAVAVRCKVFMFNLHTLGGIEMMREAVESAEGESERLGIRRPLILGVTILTSLDRRELNRLGIMRSVRREVIFLSKLAQKAGLDGVVCSPREIRYIRDAVDDDFVIVTPGIRPKGPLPGRDGISNGIKQEDQKRVAAPAEAVREGADYIVVGRPITEAKDPFEAANAIMEDIA